MAIEYIAFQDKLNPSDWRVEGLAENNEVHIALFAGPEAEKSAVEWAMFKNRTHPIFKAIVPQPPLTAPIAYAQPTGRFNITTKNGFELAVALDDMTWVYDDHRKTLLGRPKPVIEIKRGITPKGK